MSTTTNHGNHRKGTTVINTEHSPKAPHSTGIFAALRALLRIKGSGAPKTVQGTRTPSPTRALTTIAATLLASAGVTAALSATASAYATIEGPPVFSSAPGLPDGRVYEQVSPADKNGNEAGSTTSPFITGATQRYGYAAPEGNSVLFEGTGPMGESPSPDSVLFMAHRSSTGWSTRALAPAPQGKPVGALSAQAGYVDPSQDLSHSMLLAGGYALAPEPNVPCEGDEQLYLTGRDPFVAATWLEQPAIDDPIENCGSYLSSGAPAGGTPDFSTVYFTYPGTLLPEDASRAQHVSSGVHVEAQVEAWGFYEDHEGELREAGVLPADSPYPGEPSPFGAVPAASGHGKALAGNQVSENGSRAFFVSPDPDSCAGGHNNCTLDPPELYVRENGAKTVLVSQSQLPGEAGEPAPSGPLRMPNPAQETVYGNTGSYVFASPDGSQAFFQSEDALTEPAQEASPGTEPKTYDFDLETGALTYLPGVVGEIVATNKDGSSFAFVKPEAGAAPAELDLWSAGPSGGSVTQVTQLPGPPSSDVGFEGGKNVTPYVAEGRMSTDGSVLVFETLTPIAGFNNGGTHPLSGGGVGPGTEQVYRYDVPANTLGCVSCPPHGITPSGGASISSIQPNETYEQNAGEDQGVVDSRGISSDGDRVFFDTPDPLVPQDTNTNAPKVECTEANFCPQGRDVYEWENGVVYLISGGKSPRDSFLLDNSENGADAFFATTEGLVPGDTDGGYDVYDARVPHPGDNPPAAAVPCEGSVCQGPPNVPSPLTPPASATFSGLGNPAPEPAATPPPPKKTTTKTVKCKKGFVKKKSKCIKKVRHERKKNRRSKK